MGQKRRNSNEGIHVTFWTGLLSLALASSVGVGAGYFVGSRFPQGLDPEISDEVTIRPQATAGLDSPIPSEVYSFYDMLDTPEARPAPTPAVEVAAAEPTEAPAVELDPVVADAEPVAAEQMVAAEEPVAVAAEEVREVERIVPPPAPAAEQERAQEREAVARPEAFIEPEPESEQVLASSRTISRTVVRTRTAARPSVQTTASEPTTWTASRGMTRRLADSLTSDLRGVGLIADTQAGSDGLFEVVVRLTGSDDDQARQRALAERINRAGE